MESLAHRQLALFLAILVLFSTTGIGLTTYVCQCTGQSSLALLSPEFHKTCCHHQKKPVKKQPKSNCCSPKLSKGTKVLDNSSKGCCDSNYEYIASDINLSNSSVDLVLPLTISILDNHYYGYSYQDISLLVQDYYTNLSNKAPPFYSGKDRVIKYQNFRC
jgi:hypothetical protein